MKRFLAITIAFCMIVPLALAEKIDLSSFSYKELLDLIDQAQRQIVFSDEWQEVEVPPGFYLVGEDIPEGKWTITANDAHAPTISLSILDEKSDRINDYPEYKQIDGIMLIGTKHPYYYDGKMTSVSWNLQNGQYFSVSDGNVIFTPYKGLGFVFKGQETEDSAQIHLGNFSQNPSENENSAVNEQEQALTEQIKQIDNLNTIRKSIIRDLTSTLSNTGLDYDVNESTGEITVNSDNYFDNDNQIIKEEGQNFLNRFIPTYIDILTSNNYIEYLDEIIIEIHPNPAGSYQHNLPLAQNQALQIMLYCLNMPSLSRIQKTALIEKGRSVVKLNPVSDFENSGNPSHIKFKFMLDDSGIINEICNILEEMRK